ncbi:MAG: hypothetical protein COB54_04110 [Alphaproteobacteria bacterium]|nr:MAG: hypothetical protein COB54_04110 [Alphaproteobacteria bacterium]
MREYFVGYDYGMGGHWFFIQAASLNEITDKYPNIPVWKEVPDWMFIPPKSDKRFTTEMREMARLNKPSLIADIEKSSTYSIKSIPLIVHNVLVGKDFNEFFVEQENKGEITFYLIVAFSKEEISGRYPNLRVYENVPDHLLNRPETLEDTKLNRRFHIQNIPDEINIFLKT